MVPPGAVELHWQAPPQCPDRAAVLQQVDGYAANSQTPTPIVANGRIVEVGQGYALELTVRDGSGESTRRIEHEACEPLGSAAALVIAVGMDAVAVAGSWPVADAPTPATEPEPLPEPAPEPDAEPALAEPPPVYAEPEPEPPAVSRKPPRQPVRPRLLLRPEVQVGTAILPGIAGAGFGGAVGLFGPHWRAEVEGAYWLPRRATVTGLDVGGRLSLAYGGARGCYVVTPGAVDLPFCGGVEVGSLGGSAFGEGIRNAPNRDVWVGAPLSVGVAWAPVRAFALYARGEAAISLRRPGFHLEGVGQVHRAGAVGARAVLGAEVRFF